MYRDWIRKGLEQKGKSNKGLARHLGVHDAVVSRMVHGKRPIKADELPRIAEYLELQIPTSQNGSTARTLNPATDAGAGLRVGHGPVQTHLVPVKFKLARGVWREDRGSLMLSGLIPAVADSRLKDIEQYACEFEDATGRYAIFVPYYSYRRRPLHGDRVHVRRTRGDLTENALRIVDTSEARVRLIAVDDDEDVISDPSHDPDETVHIEGLMVGRYEKMPF